MAEETLFRVVSLAIIMLAIGGGFYYKKINDLQKDAEDIDSVKIKKQAKKPAVKYSVIVGVIYMVLVLAVAGLTG